MNHYIEFIYNAKRPHYHYKGAFNSDIYNKATFGGMSRWEAYSSLGFGVDEDLKTDWQLAVNDEENFRIEPLR